MTTLTAALDDISEQEAVRLLWDTYDPWLVWYYLGAFGIAGTIGMIIFYLATKKSVAESEEAEEDEASDASPA